MAINLLPWRERQMRRQMYQYGLWLLASGMIITLTMVLIRYGFIQVENNTQFKNLELSQQITTLNLPKDSKILTDNNQIATAQVKLMQAVELNHRRFWQELALLQHQLPPDAMLNHLLWDGQALNLQGATRHAATIGLIIKVLENSHLFLRVTLDNINKADQDAIIHFVLHADILEETGT